RDESAGRLAQPEGARHFRGDRVDAQAELAALHDAVLDELPHHPPGGINRDGEADSDVVTAAGEDGRVDADQIAPEVHECAARVARIDGGVGLDVVLEIIRTESGALQPADYSRGDGVRQPERIADRD